MKVHMFSDLNIFSENVLSFDVVKTELHMFIMAIFFQVCIWTCIIETFHFFPWKTFRKILIKSSFQFVGRNMIKLSPNNLCYI